MNGAPAASSIRRRMLLALLLYCYATGVFSSRRIEQATYDSVPVRMICGDTHPDHDTICTFRRENKALLQETFVRVLELAQALKFLQVGQITVAVDGTKVLANASKHAAVSYEHAGKTIEQLDLEVKELLAKAEQADSTPLEDGLSIPARGAAPARAQSQAGSRHGRRLKRGPKRERRQIGRIQGETGGAGGPKRTRAKAARPRAQGARRHEPKPSDQYNFTDPESRIMKAGSGQHFEQSYNAQAAVEVDSRLIVGERVSQAPNDKQELVPTVAAIAQPVESVAAVLTDSGFYSEAAVQTVEQTAEGQPTGTTVYAALEKKEHHRTVSDLEKKQEPGAPAPGASVERGDEAPAKNRRGQSQVQIAAADGGTGLWDH